MSPLGIILIILILALLVPGLLVKGLFWLLIIAVVLALVGAFSGGWRA